MKRAAVTVAGPADVSRVPALPRVLYAAAGGVPRPGLVERLAACGYATDVALDAGAALRRLLASPFAACVVDLAGDRPSLTSVRLIRARHAALPLVGLIDPQASLVAADAVRGGVTDLLVWPFDDGELAVMLANLRDRAAARGVLAGHARLFAHSVVMRDLLRRLRAEAVGLHGVCLSGAPGTGKCAVAETLHETSARAAGPFLAVDCADRTPSELEHELFGGEGDGPAPAPERISPDSTLARAMGGTLYLAHLSEAPARVQLRLARLLRDREVVVGEAGRPADLDVRVVGAVDGTVEAACDAGRLQRELGDRLTIRAELPALRLRGDDLPLLATHLLAAACAARREPPRSFSRAGLAVMAALPWPGNGPELERTIEALLTSQPGAVVEVEDVLRHARLDGGPRFEVGVTLREARERFERECIAATLVRHGGKVGEAARALGIQRTNLYRKVRQLGLSRNLLSNPR